MAKFIPGIHIPIDHRRFLGVTIFHAVPTPHRYMQGIIEGGYFLWDDSDQDAYLGGGTSKRLWAVWDHEPTQEEIQVALVENRLKGL